jgi:hypothetical protein
MLRASQKDKLASASASKAVQGVEGLDRWREVLCRNDCAVQGNELASFVDETHLSVPKACKPLANVEFATSKPYENAEWLRDLEAGNNQARATQRAQVQERMTTLQQEHESRLAERANILEKELVEKLEKEHVQYK